MKAIELDPEEQLFTLTETADYLRCSKPFLWHMRKEGKLTAYRIGNKVLFKKADIDTFLARNKVLESISIYGGDNKIPQ